MIPSSASQIERLCQLGSCFDEKGTIWTATNHSSHFAIKIYDLDKISEDFERVQDEINLVRQLNNKNVINYLSTFSNGQNLWIVMPLFGYTSIARVVATHFMDGLPEQALSLIFKDIISALQYLHGRGIIHRGIRGSHILVNSEGKCVLSGFRHSTNAICKGIWQRPLHSYPPEIATNLNWASPEMLRQDIDGYCEKTDIYSIGITMCELGNGEVPYSHLEPQLKLVEKNYTREPFLRDTNTCKIENGKDSGMGESYEDCVSSTSKLNDKVFSSSCHDFVSLCLAFDPLSRPSADKLLGHSFIKKSRKCHLTLPQLLHPVTPINSSTDFGKTDAEILQKLDNMKIFEDPAFEWAF